MVLRVVLVDSESKCSSALENVSFLRSLFFSAQGPPKFTKAVLKKGDKANFPKKGDTVACWYTGMLEDGTVFDTNIPSGWTAILMPVFVCLGSIHNCVFN